MLLLSINLKKIVLLKNKGEKKMFPINMDEKMVILIGLGVIIISLVFRERLDTTFDLKKWSILLILGLAIYAVYANPNNVFPKLTLPILSMAGLFILIHF